MILPSAAPHFFVGAIADRLAPATVAVNLALAALVGLAVGLEREWSGHASGPNARFAGIRTFLLLGIVGGTAGILADLGLGIIGAALVAGGGALTAVAYRAATDPRRVRVSPEPPALTPSAAAPSPASSTEDVIGGTTEAAALAVLGLGVLAGLGMHTLAAGAGAVLVFALAEKGAFHAAVRRIDSLELRAGVQFAVLALVILPLLPEGPFGPWGGIRPRQLWIVVLIFSAINFAGYVARRIIGEDRGYGVTGMLGGVISSTAVTLTFARQSRVEPEHSRALGLGVVAACTVLVPRVATVVAVLNPALLPVLVVFVLPMFVFGLAIVAYVLWRGRGQPAAASAVEVKNPLHLWSAVRMAIAFQVVLTAIAIIRADWGTAGVLTSAAVLGLTDVDALTLAMSRLGTTPALVETAARAILVGIVANTVLKLAIALALGTPRFRRVAAPGLVALGAVGGVTLWLL